MKQVNELVELASAPVHVQSLQKLFSSPPHRRLLVSQVNVHLRGNYDHRIESLVTFIGTRAVT